MPVILLYGIYGGATTPTEAAAIAAAYALILAVVLLPRAEPGASSTPCCWTARRSIGVGRRC